MRDKSFYFKKGPRAVLLFHAFSSTPNDVRKLGRALEREGYTVYAPVFSGHGTKDPEDVLNETADKWYEDAKKALAFLKTEGFQSIAAFGLSMGGIMAVRLLLEESLIGGGTFASPVVPSDINHVPEKFWPQFAYIKEKQGEDPTQISQTIEILKPELREILDGLARFVEKMVPAYPKLEKPVFIGQGGEDEIIDPETAFRFAESLPNTTVDFHWYENGKHALTVGESGNELQQDVLYFLENLDWNGGEEWNQTKN